MRRNPSDHRPEWRVAARAGGRRSRGLAPRVRPRGRRGATARQEALDTPHEGVEGGPSVALAEMSSREAANEAINAEAAHGLVAEAQASERVTAHDQAPASDDLAMLVDSKREGPHRTASAPAEDTEVVGVLKVLDEHEVAVVKEGGQLPDREVPDAPGVLVLVGEAGVKYQAPERSSGLVDSAQWFDEEGERAVPWHDLDNALPSPCSELGAES